jgi:hypothetical protein
MSKTVNEMDTFRDGLKHLGWRWAQLWWRREFGGGS